MKYKDIRNDVGRILERLLKTPQLAVMLVHGEIKVVQVTNSIVTTQPHNLIGIYDRKITPEALLNDIYDYVHAK